MTNIIMVGFGKGMINMILQFGYIIQPMQSLSSSILEDTKLRVVENPMKHGPQPRKKYARPT